MIEDLESFIKSKKESQVSLVESEKADAIVAVGHGNARFCSRYCTNLLDPKDRKCEDCRFFDCSVNECNPGLFD